MTLSDRKKKILRAVIDDYIDTAEPVGSKTISKNSDLGLSSATIRNEMSELEDMGFLEQPHTSAGRIPSPRGYRLYVNELMERHRLSIEETDEINRTLRARIRQLDHMISEAGQMISRLTRYPAYALASAPAQVTISRFDLIFVDSNTFIIVAMMSNNTVKNKLVHLPISTEQSFLARLSTMFNASFTNIGEDLITHQLISATERASGDTMGLVPAIAGFAIQILSETRAGEAYLAGSSNLLQHPEYHDVDKAQKLLSYLSEESELLKLPMPESDSNLKITIGPENLARELKDSSVVVARYNAGDNMQGLIGVVGPTRMDYSKVAAKLSYIARGLGSAIAGEEYLFPPEEDDDS